MSNEPPTSASERLERALDRIASPDTEGEKVFTEVFADSAKREAAASDVRLAGGASLGPLDGRIVSVKSLFDIAGRVTSAGSAILRTLPAKAADAAVVVRLRNAGAVVIGTTRMTELAFSALGTNPHEGAPGNPRDRSRAPGGSSSGAVVSVVDGMAEIAIGSDTGGSIRIPAALSGAVGFKPTSGRVPTQGSFSLSSTLDTVGPIALSVADCTAADHVLAGPAAADDILATSAAPMTTASCRLVVARGRLFDRCEPEVLGAFEHALDLLRHAGAQLAEGSLDAALDDVAEIDALGTFPPIEVSATLRSLGFTSLDRVGHRTRERIEAGAGVLATDYVRMGRLRQSAVAAFERTMTAHDAFLLPTTPIRAPLLSSIEDSATFHDRNGLVLRNPRIANLLDCPSISLPIPVPGLPVGLMLIGRTRADRSLLAIASLIEAVLASGTR